MIKREAYLKKIRPFYESDLIKVITGIRRSGKSVILKEVFEEIRAVSDNCIFLDFDIRPTLKIVPDADALIDYISKNRKDSKCYVFLDEIQNVKEWNEACRTLRLMECSVFITGSNSKLLSSEFTKELSGRYVAFRVRPFVYREAMEYARELGKDFGITDYLTWGCFPASLEQKDQESLKIYLSDLNDTIIVKDLETRYKIRMKEVFERFVDYILVSNSRIYSAQSISQYFKSQSITISTPTVIKYLGYLKEAYIIDEIPQFSNKTKSKMSFYQKLYNADVSLNSIRCSGIRYDLTHNMENIVYNELIFMGYEVSVFRNNNKEIDFRAEKDGKVFYVQVAYSVVEDKAYEREFAAFADIDNNSKKILITNDDVDYSTSIIYHYKLRDFLLMDEL